MHITNLMFVKDQDIYECFNDAFSDYMGFRNVSYEDFLNMMFIRGMNKQYSYGCFDDNHLVGVIINALNKNKDIAYVVSLGVRPNYRRKNIGQNLMNHSIEILTDLDLKEYMLEVITKNEKAFNLYKKLGFEIIRELNCYKIQKNDQLISNFKVIEKEMILEHQVKDLIEFEPSWQNSFDALNKNPKQFDYLTVEDRDRIIGYAICDPVKKQIMQIGVENEYRKKGIATSLINKVFDNSDAQHLGLLNIDNNCIELISLLDKYNKVEVIKQYELSKLLKG